MTEEEGLSQVTLEDLERLRRAVGRGAAATPLSQADLMSVSLGHISEACQLMFGLEHAAVLALLDAVIAERRQRRSPKLSLVWTGPDAGISLTRYTRVVVPELFERARKHVLVAGYSFDHGDQVFGPLHQTMRDHGVTAQLFLDIRQVYERLRSTAQGQHQDVETLCAPVEAARGQGTSACIAPALHAGARASAAVPGGRPRPASRAGAASTPRGPWKGPNPTAGHPVARTEGRGHLDRQPQRYYLAVIHPGWYVHAPPVGSPTGFLFCWVTRAA